MKHVSAFVTLEFEQPLVIRFTKLVAYAEDAEAKVVVSCKYFDLSATLEHNINNGINVLRFLWFLSDFSKYSVPTYIPTDF